MSPDLLRARPVSPSPHAVSGMASGDGGDAGRAIEVEEIASTDALAAMGDAWARLWEAATEPAVFQHPAWALAWWRHLGGGSLRALLMRRGGLLVGLAPLFCWRDPETGDRLVRLLGAGVSDRLGPVAAPADEEACAAAVLAHIAAIRDAWDVCELGQMRPGAALARAPAPAGLVSTGEAGDACAVLALPASPDGLEGTPAGRLLRKHRYLWRRAEREGGAEVVTADAASAGAMFDATLRLHRLRWAARGEGGVLDAPGVAAFHRDVAEAAARAGLLRLHLLRVGGQDAAAFYGFAGGGTLAYYLGGFDPAWAHLSPGALVVGHALTEAVGEGMRRMDFLRGREAYKAAWGAADEPTARRVLRPEAP